MITKSHKLLVAVFLIAALPFMTMAQSIGIGTDVPHSSAILDVSSINKGLLLPRLTYTQRTSIASPAVGLLVYQTNSSTTPAGFYMYTAAGWKEIAQAEDLVVANSWTVSGNNQYSGVPGFVGIGTSSPTEKLHISNGQLRLSRTGLFENSIVFNMPSASGSTTENEGLKFSIAGVEKGFLGFSSSPFFGDYFRISTNGVGGSQLAITAAGNVGIGTVLPTERLQVAGNALLNASNPTLQLQNEGVDKGFVQLSGDNIRLGTNSSNTSGKLVMRLAGADHVFVENDGKVGIGQDDPQAKLHINSGASIEALRLTGNTNTLIRFMTGGTEKANIYAANNHLALSVVQPGGQVRLGNEVYIDEDLSRVGIGTTVPDVRLHVAGDIKTNSGKLLNNENINMMPVAMAYFDINANKIRGTSNITAYRQTVNSVYRNFVVTVTGVGDLSTAIIMVTGVGGKASVSQASGNQVNVNLWSNVSEETDWSPFHIVIYN